MNSDTNPKEPRLDGQQILHTSILFMGNFEGKNMKVNCISNDSMSLCLKYVRFKTLKLLS